MYFLYSLALLVLLEQALKTAHPEGFPRCDNYSCAIFAAAASLLIDHLSSQMPQEENFAFLAHIQIICFRRNLTEVCKGM